MYYVGLDVGTSALKSTVIDDLNQIVFESAYAYYPARPQEGYCEIEPEIWFSNAVKALEDILNIYRVDDISALGVTGQMHSTVFLDKDGQSIRPAILWNDIRTADMIEKIKHELEDKVETYFISKIISTGCPATNILWVKEHEPENYSKIEKVMTAYDYIVFRLTGNYSEDYCDASTSSLFNIRNKNWSSYMLSKLEKEENILPPVYASSHIVGNVSFAILQKLHVSGNIPVITGTGDNPATAVAMNILNETDPVISLGTSGVAIVAKQDGDFEGKGKNVLFAPDDERIVNIVQGTVQAAGGAHKWWIENIVISDDFTLDQDKIEENDLGNNSIIFYPHISGDKTTYADPHTKGAFIGLTYSSTRKDMTQSLLEGVGFAIRELLENMGLKKWPDRIKINGGGSKSRIWMQILADILHTEVESVVANATPGYGVCLLAHSAIQKERCGEIESGSSTVYYPDQQIVEKYNVVFKKYQNIHDALKVVDV